MNLQVGDVFRSNGGRGPIRAKIVDFPRAGEVRLYHWNERKGDARRCYFTLKERFFDSPSCGWRPVAPPLPQERADR